MCVSSPRAAVLLGSIIGCEDPFSFQAYIHCFSLVYTAFSRRRNSRASSWAAVLLGRFVGCEDPFSLQAYIHCFSLIYIASSCRHNSRASPRAAVLLGRFGGYWVKLSLERCSCSFPLICIVSDSGTLLLFSRLIFDTIKLIGQQIFACVVASDFETRRLTFDRS